MKNTIFSILFLLSSSVGLYSQDVTVSAAFDSSRIYIGDQIFYTLTIDQPVDLNLTIRPLKDSLCKNVEILSGPFCDSSLTNNRLKVINRYLITSFDSGFYQAPPVYAEINTSTGIKRFYSDYSALEVMRVKITPPDTTAKIFDIIKPYRAPITIGEILPWVLLTCAVASLVWGLIILIRKFKKSRKEPEIAINKEPAHIIAFRELGKLKEEQLWQKGEVKHYYSRLTEILRQYLENRYGVFSLEMTTSETLDALVKSGFKKDDLYSGLRTILTGSDLVKFAKYKPEPAENEVHFENSWKFVEFTKVDETIQEQAGSNEKKEGSL
ncbi:MAG: hypothetical protein MUC93_05995 [Bacteroidales bacterium]|nr:hypothetical protein [Bacteroidales bacterium]